MKTIDDSLIPYVDDDEQAEIDEELGSPSDYENEEIIDMTDWVNNKESCLH